METAHFLTTFCQKRSRTPPGVKMGGARALQGLQKNAKGRPRIFSSSLLGVPFPRLDVGRVSDPSPRVKTVFPLQREHCFHLRTGPPFEVVFGVVLESKILGEASWTALWSPRAFPRGEARFKKGPEFGSRDSRGIFQWTFRGSQNLVDF